MSRTKKIFLLLPALAVTATAFAQQQQGVPPKAEVSPFTNGVFDVLLAVIILLLFVIIGMAEVVKAGAAQQRTRIRKEKSSAGKIPPVAMLAFFFLTFSSLLHGQAAAPTAAATPAPPAADFDYWGLGAGVFYLMLIIIFIEILFAYLLFRSGMMLIRKEIDPVLLAEMKKEEPSLLDKLNQSVSVEHEEAIMMDHDYDGIRELDNNLPPWWKYGFYLTIIFAVVYLSIFHVFHTGKLSAEEYAQQMKDGDSAVAEYRKTAADLVDETTVTRLTDPASIAAGKAVFVANNCAACHGQFGEGKDGGGPNFTDDFWLHGGSVQSIFKSIKYGWTEKGMKSWQQDIKASDIQLLASYIKSLHGTNPPNAKAPQGDLYIEDGQKPLATADSAGKNDSTKPKADSLKK